MPTSPDPAARDIDRRWRLVAALGIAVFLALAWRFRDHKVDDAFISFRYARHLTGGLGFVFNPGERVEGYSNFLWVVLLAGGLKLGISAEILSVILGVAASVGTIVVVSHASAKLRLSPAVAWVPTALLAVNPAFVVWSTGGLETNLQIFLVTFGVTRLAFRADGARPPLDAAVLLLLAALNRPEGVLVGAVAGAVLLVQLRRSPESRRAALIWAGMFAAGFAAYFLWRWNYFGYLLPNTFYAKVDVGGSQVGRGFAYLAKFGGDLGLWLLFPLAGIVAVRGAKLAYMGTAVLAHLGFVVFVGGDGLPMHRFLVPVMGLLFLLVALGGDAALRVMGLSHKLRVAVGAALAIACLYSAKPNFSGVQHRHVMRDVEEVAAWSEIGIWFREHAEPGATIAVLPAGAMPWYSGLRTLDMLGLTEPAIAHTPVAMGSGVAGHEKFNVAYVLEKAPKYVVIGVFGFCPAPVDPRQCIDPSYPVEHELLRSREFASRYRIRQGQSRSGYFTYFERM